MIRLERIDTQGYLGECTHRFCMLLDLRTVPRMLNSGIDCNWYKEGMLYNTSMVWSLGKNRR